jgi:hypothetical protein
MQAVCEQPRELLRAKKLDGIAFRVTDTLKDAVERRARERDRNVSQHILDLVLADLATQQRSRETLSDVCADASNAIELASMGIHSDAQRIYVLRRVTRFAVHILGEEMRIS